MKTTSLTNAQKLLITGWEMFNHLMEKAITTMRGGEGWSYEIANNNTRDAKNVSFTLDCRIIIIIQQKQVLRGAIGRLIK